MPPNDTQRALTPNIPPNDLLRDYLRALHRVSATVYHRFHRRVIKLSGTPQARLDWTDPDTWMPQRLEGMELKVARRIWERSGHRLNPRYVDGPWLFSRTHGLLREDEDGFFHTTARGRAFLAGDPETVAEIDQYEGILTILAIVAARGPAKREILYPDWEAFCVTYTGYHSRTSIAWALLARLQNLMGRGMVGRNGYAYAITEAGADYLAAESGRVEHVPGPG
jgi:restriction system protein